MLPTNKREEDIAEYWKKQGLEHSDSSPETIKRFDALVDKLSVLPVISANISFIKGEVTETKKHVKDTNGKVALNTKWRNYIFAGLIILTFLLPMMSSFFIYALNDMRSDLKNEITIAIDKNNDKYFE